MLVQASGRGNDERTSDEQSGREDRDVAGQSVAVAAIDPPPDDANRQAEELSDPVATTPPPNGGQDVLGAVSATDVTAPAAEDGDGDSVPAIALVVGSPKTARTEPGSAEISDVALMQTEIASEVVDTASQDVSPETAALTQAAASTDSDLDARSLAVPTTVDRKLPDEPEEELLRTQRHNDNTSAGEDVPASKRTLSSSPNRIKPGNGEARTVLPLSSTGHGDPPELQELAKPVEPSGGVESQVPVRPSSFVPEGNPHVGPGHGMTLSDRQQARLVDRVSRAFAVARQRRGPLRIRLHPPELGALRLELHVTRGAVRAHIETDSQAARTVLLEHVSQLRDRLAEHGMRVESLDIEWRQPPSGGQHGQHPQDFADAQGRSGGASSNRVASADESSDTTEQRSSTARPLDTGELAQDRINVEI